MSRDRSGAVRRWLPTGADMDGADIMDEPSFLCYFFWVLI